MRSEVITNTVIYDSTELPTAESELSLHYNSVRKAANVVMAAGKNPSESCVMAAANGMARAAATFWHLASTPPSELP